MSSQFSADFFVSNRRKLLELFRGSAPIVLSANGSLQRIGDTAFPFQQDANFWYLTGINYPDVILVMDKGKEYLIIPGRSSTREVFDGGIDVELIKKRSGISEVYDSKDGWNKLSQRIKKVQHVASVAPTDSYIENFGFYTNPSRQTIKAKLQTINEELTFLDLTLHFARMRIIKQPDEIKAIKAAIKITEDAIKETVRPSKLPKYDYEYEIEANITKGMRFRGARGHAFDPIVAAGINACTLHNVSNESMLNKRDLVVLDVGAEYENYSADITRTYSLSTKPSKRQKDVYEAVKDTQEYAISLLVPGKILKEYEEQIESYMGEKLRSLGLIKSINRENVRQYFPHATSHFLGLNVHDIGEYDKPLQPGVVITAEPGIYIKEEAIGVRIEDDVLITNKGSQVLSTRLPKNL